MYLNECSWCKKKFESKHSRKKYCSPVCANKAAVERARVKRSLMPKEVKVYYCLNCGKEFTDKKGGRKHCSEVCCREYNDKRQKELYKKPLANRLCEHCGKAFMPKTPWMKFCSDECREAKKLEERKGGRTGVNIPPKPVSVYRTEASKRWAVMTIDEVRAESLRLHKSYGELQVMALCECLPDDFGSFIKRRKGLCL